MEFDINAARASYDPWSLVIVVNGERHPVREVTAEAFVGFVAAAPEPGSEEEIDIVAGLFTATTPDVRAWGQAVRDEVTTVLSAYVGARTEHKRQKIRKR